MEKEIMEEEMVREMVHCVNCDELVAVEDVKDYDGEPYCEDCYNEIFYTCDDCGKIIREEDIVMTHDERIICCNCSSDNYMVCDDCGALVPNNDIYQVHGYDRYVCDDCYCNGDYTACRRCDDIYHIDHLNYSERHDEYYCDSCYSEYATDTLAYVDFPLRKLEDGVTYLGAELEVGSYSIGDPSLSYKIKDILGEKYLLNIHDDCSVTEDDIRFGGEIVFQPLTIEEINSDDFQSKLQDVITLLKENDFEQCAETCGFHIHFSRLGNEDIAKLYLLSNFFKKEFESIGARYHSHWCDVLYDSTEYCKLKESIPSNENFEKRYVFWNRQNRNTIECRAFESNLDLDTIIKRYNVVYRCALLSRTQKKNITFNYLLTGNDTIKSSDRVLSLDTLRYVKEAYRKKMEVARIKLHLKTLLHDNIKEKLSKDNPNYNMIREMVSTLTKLDEVDNKRSVIELCRPYQICEEYIETLYKGLLKNSKIKFQVGDMIVAKKDIEIPYTLTNQNMIKGKIIDVRFDDGADIRVKIIDHTNSHAIGDEYYVDSKYFELWRA